MITMKTETERDPESLTLVRNACELCEHGDKPLERTCARCITDGSKRDKPGFRAKRNQKGGKSAPVSDTMIESYETHKADPGALTLWLDTLRINSLQRLAAHLKIKGASGIGKYDLIGKICEES